MNKGDVNTEKHVPFVEKTEKGYKVSVGKPAIHPMTEEHYIEYIELYVDGNLVAKKTLEQGEEPIVEFECNHSDNVYAIEHCNLHGTWTDQK